MKNCNSTYYVIVIEDITMPGGLVIGNSIIWFIGSLIINLVYHHHQELQQWLWRGSSSIAVEVLGGWRMWLFQISTGMFLRSYTVFF